MNVTLLRHIINPDYILQPIIIIFIFNWLDVSEII